VKPVAMIADAILDCSARGDIVLDNFSGVGSGNSREKPHPVSRP
jgi:hypothetical protein